MAVFVGLDCGGSTSRVLAIDSAGSVLFQGQSGPANLAATPEHRLKANIGRATDECPAPDAVCGCFAGLISEELRQRAIAMLSTRFPGAHVRAEPDYVAALFASPPETDLCIIAGTGSLVCSRSNGLISKSGGRGYLLGDEGSGFHYGRDALMQFLNTPKSASAALRRSIEETFSATDEPTIVSYVYKSGSAQMLLSRLAKALFTDAKAGLPYATESVERHTASLAAVAADHVRRYLPNRKELQICLVGGTWTSASFLREQFESKLQETLVGVTIGFVRGTKPPVYGAVQLAKEMVFGNGS